MQISYSSLAPKQNTQSQSLISEDEYLDLIRNTDLVKNPQTTGSKATFGYATAAPTTAMDSTYDSYATKSPFSGNEYKKYTSRTHVPPTPSSPVPNLQPQNSQQQFVRQPAHFISQPAHYVTTAPQVFGQTFDKDTVRVNLKKYHEPIGKTKYELVRGQYNGQYHEEVSVKPTKKVVSFKPSYQYASTAQTQLSNQQSVAQPQPLHYQSVQQITQSEPSKTGQQQSSQPQSQYSIVVPQSQAQQAYYSSDDNNQFQSFLPQNERLIASSFGQTGLEQPTGPQQSDNKPNGQSDFRIQYVHHVSATPTPTPTPRTRFVSDGTSQGQPLKYELFDSNANVKDTPPKIKLVPAPHDTPQYYKKVKVQPVQPAAHVHYVPVRTQYHQPTAQPSQASPQAHPELLLPIQPSRSTLFVSPSTGKFGLFLQTSKQLIKFLFI